MNSVFFLKNCNYPNHVINKAFFNAKLQGPAPEPSRTTVLPFVTTNYANFNHLPTVRKIHRYINELEFDPELKNVFDDCKIILSQKQPKNLLSHLTKAKFTTQNTSNQPPGTFKCNRKNCKICHMYFQEATSFLTASNETWIVKDHITCNSKNVIYYLKCNRCLGKTTYIGKTVNLRLRTNGHISGCRLGNGPDKFDNHVFKCNSDNIELKEPFFQMYAFMSFPNSEPLLTYESHLQELGYDTMNH